MAVHRYTILGCISGIEGVPGGSDGKESICNTGDPDSIPGLGSYPGEWLPIPVFLPGESHGRRSQMNSWGHRESDMTHAFTFTRN